MTQPPNTGDSGYGGYGAPPPQDPYGAAPGGYGAAPQPHPRGTLILVLGILSIVCCGIFTGIPAVIMGNTARKEVAANPTAYSNGGMVTAGFICGIVGIALSVLSILIYAGGVMSR